MFFLNYTIHKVDIIQTDHIYHIKQYQTFYRKIKYGGEQNEYHHDFQRWFLSNFSWCDSTNVKIYT